MKQILRRIVPVIAVFISLFFLKPGYVSAADFTVTNSNDSGAGSLRQAILDANANPGADQINFAVPGSGIHTTVLATPLPNIIETVVVNGQSQPGTICDGASTQVRIAINFNSLIHGLQIDDSAPGTEINGLALYGARAASSGGNGAALRIAGDNSVVRCNFFGTDDGVAVRSSGSGPVGTWSNDSAWIWQADGVRIGGPNPSDFNLFAGEAAHATGGTGATNAHIEGNYIGVNIDGSAKLGSSSVGVGFMYGVQVGNTIKNNVISGIDGNGISVQNLEVGSMNLAIVGNRIGTNAIGSSAIPNAENGIYISGITANTIIGGSTTTDRNIIAGNAESGIFLAGSTGGVVQNNYIGTVASGAALLSNGWTGVDIQATGESWHIADNVINSGPGVGYSAVSISAGRNHIVRNNRIGVNSSATAALSNFSAGVAISSNEVGGTLIEGNTFGALSAPDGYIYLLSGSGHRVRANYFGTNASRTITFGAVSQGVNIASTSVSNTMIGGVVPADANVFVNILRAVTSSAADTAILGNVFQGNQYPIWFAVPLVPEIISYNTVGANTEIEVQLGTSFPAGEYRLELFSNDTYENASSGIDAQVHIGTATIVKTSSGSETFTANISGTGHTFPTVTATLIDLSSDGFGKTSMLGRHTVLPSSDIFTSVSVDQNDQFTVRVENLGPVAIAGGFSNYLNILFWVPPGLDYLSNTLDSEFSCTPYPIAPYDTSGTLMYCISLTATLPVGDFISFNVVTERNNTYSASEYFKVAGFSTTDPDQAAILGAVGTSDDFFALSNNSIALYQGADEGADQEEQPGGSEEEPEQPSEEDVERGGQILASARSEMLSKTGSGIVWYVYAAVLTLCASTGVLVLRRRSLG
jgi:hypothetical protein